MILYYITYTNCNGLVCATKKTPYFNDALAMKKDLIKFSLGNHSARLCKEQAA